MTTSKKRVREAPAPAASSRVNLRLLEIFVCVAQERSMSAAAQRIGISQPAVSQSLISLEEALGIALFDRSVRPPALTLGGSSVFKLAREVIDKLQELQNIARSVTSRKVPLLRIGMIESFTAAIGADMLNRLEDVAEEWTVASGIRATGYQALLERRSDVVITSDDQPVPDAVTASTILTESCVLAVPSNYSGDVGNLRSLARELSFIRLSADSHLGPSIDAYLQRAGVQTATRYQFDNTDAVLRMVAAGFGWTIVTPLVFLKSYVPSQHVRLLPLKNGSLRRQILVAVRKGEGEDILERVRAAALAAFEQVVPSELTGALSDVADALVVVAGNAATKKSAQKKKPTAATRG